MLHSMSDPNDGDPDERSVVVNDVIFLWTSRAAPNHPGTCLSCQFHFESGERLSHGFGLAAGDAIAECRERFAVLLDDLLGLLQSLRSVLSASALARSIRHGCCMTIRQNGRMAK
jgi:hypothetical protein